MDLLHGWAAWIWIVSIGYALVLWCTVLSAGWMSKKHLIDKPYSTMLVEFSISKRIHIQILRLRKLLFYRKIGEIVLDMRN
jgi:hypothetical protein